MRYLQTTSIRMEGLSQKEEKLKNKIQSAIHYCLNCQSRDSGEWIWIWGQRYDLEDLFDEYKVSEKLRNKIVNYLQCPFCGSSIDRYDEIGLEDKVDQEVGIHLKKAKAKYGKKIMELALGIKQHPTLGLNYSLGKLIYKEIKDRKIPKCSITGEYYRARKLKNADVLNHEDFLAPPTGKSDEGRFNHSGQSHFYITQEKETAIRECLENEIPALLWLQKFTLKKIDCILDLSYDWEDLGPSTSTLLVALHNSSELQKSKNNIDKWKPDYNLTRFIMDCSKHNGYNGIKYNSTKDTGGKNIVLFRCNKLDISKYEQPEVVIYNPISIEGQMSDIFDLPDA